MARELTVVVPTRKEAASIEQFLAALSTELAGTDAEYIVVDVRQGPLPHAAAPGDRPDERLLPRAARSSRGRRAPAARLQDPARGARALWAAARRRGSVHLR